MFERTIKKAYRGIALSYYAEGTYDQAKAYLELALKNKELSSLNRDLNAYLAECEMYLGDYEKSLKTWNALIDDLGGKRRVMAHIILEEPSYKQ